MPNNARDVLPPGAHSVAAPKRDNPLPKMGHGSVSAQWVRCGKPSCRCARGERHGPYYYRFWREDGRLRKRYVPAAEVAAVQAACEKRRLREELARTDLLGGRQTWRALSARLREVLGDG